MKAFIIGSRRDQKYTKLNDTLLKALTEAGIKVDTSQIKTEREDDASNFEVAFKRNIKAIKSSDFVVVEATELSSGIGYLIGSALNDKKPVLALSNPKIENKSSHTLKGGSVTNKLLSYKEYSPEELPNIIKQYVKKIKGMLDTKFILIISPEIDRYLEWTGEHRRMHKAQVVRGAVEEAMRKDREYREYLKSV